MCGEMFMVHGSRSRSDEQEGPGKDRLVFSESIFPLSNVFMRACQQHVEALLRRTPVDVYHDTSIDTRMFRPRKFR